MQNNLSLAQKLTQALGVTITKPYENAYQHVFKHEGDINLEAAAARGLITLVKNGSVVKEFDLDNLRFVTVSSLKTITHAKSI